MTYTYRYIGDEPTAFVTIRKNGYPGETFESDVPLSHPLLELVEDDVDNETDEVPAKKTTRYVAHVTTIDDTEIIDDDEESHDD